MNRTAFFASVRKVTGTLTQAQVDVCEAILEMGYLLDNPSMAYVLATAWHEAKLTPKRENLNYSSAARIRAVWPSRFKTDKEAQPFVRSPQALANKVYGGRLGNDLRNDGWVFRGGGLDQLTGRENYRNAGKVTGVHLESDPERILEPMVAVRSLLHGMTSGRYRGHKLSDFIKPGEVNFRGARAIVNNDVAANGERVAGYARGFLEALEVAGRKPGQALTGSQPSPAKGGLWAFIVALLKLLGKK